MVTAVSVKAPLRSVAPKYKYRSGILLVPRIPHTVLR